MAMIKLVDYKRDLILGLIGNPSIPPLIDSQSPGYVEGDPESLIYNNVFDYLCVPDINTIADTFVLLEVDIDNIPRNNTTFSRYTVIVWVMAHKNRMSLNDRNGNRIDNLAEEIKETFNGSQKFGFSEFEMLSNTGKIYDERFQYREMAFQCYDKRIAAGAVPGRRIGR